MPPKAKQSDPVDDAPVVASSEPKPVPDRDSDEWVEVFPEEGLSGATARALLDAATGLGYDEQRAVLSIGGGYRVPQDVLDAANMPTEPLPARESAPTPLAAVEQGAVLDPAPAADADEAPDAPQ